MPHVNANDDELVNDVVYQVGALSGFAALHGVKLQHVKPHGALYVHVAKSESLSRALISALQKIDANLYLYCMASSVTASVAKAMGQPVILEFYADRDSDQSGSIVFTRRVGALEPRAVAAKVLRACSEGVVATVKGGTIAIDFDSVCINSDTPGALGFGNGYAGNFGAEPYRRSPTATVALEVSIFKCKRATQRSRNCGYLVVPDQ